MNLERYCSEISEQLEEASLPTKFIHFALVHCNFIQVREYHIKNLKADSDFVARTKVDENGNLVQLTPEEVELQKLESKKYDVYQLL